MNLTKIDSDNFLILSMEGNLLGENDGKQILEMVNNAMENNIFNIIFEVEKLKYLNSTGLSILISTLTKVKKNGGELCLVNVPSQLKSLLGITKLDSMFLQSDSVENAIIKINS